MSSKHNSRRRPRRDSGQRSQDFQDAVNRLEDAVQQFVSSTGETVSDRAMGFVEDAVERLEREVSDRRRRHSTRRRSRRKHYSRSRNGSFSSGYRTRRLYRDPRRGKIGGVCAGLARYFGLEMWVVRCMALTGLIFMGSIVVPAYLIAWVVLEKVPRVDDGLDRASRGDGDREYASPAPELGPRFSPRRNLRDAQADLDQLELKLRRMETHVTSGQYELQRELNRIDT